MIPYYSMNNKIKDFWNHEHPSSMSMSYHRHSDRLLEDRKTLGLIGFTCTIVSYSWQQASLSKQIKSDRLCISGRWMEILFEWVEGLHPIMHEILYVRCKRYRIGCLWILFLKPKTIDDKRCKNHRHKCAISVIREGIDRKECGAGNSAFRTLQEGG